MKKKTYPLFWLLVKKRCSGQRESNPHLLLGRQTICHQSISALLTLRNGRPFFIEIRYYKKAVYPFFKREYLTFRNNGLHDSKKGYKAIRNKKVQNRKQKVESRGTRRRGTFLSFHHYTLYKKGCAKKHVERIRDTSFLCGFLRKGEDKDTKGILPGTRDQEPRTRDQKRILN